MSRTTTPPRFPKSLPGELWGVVSYHNPAAYKTKLENFKTFAAGVRVQGLKLLAVELAHGETSFEVPEDLCDIVVRRRSDCVLWHKERLLNMGVSALPASCDKLVWLDGDIIFQNDAWVSELAAELESFVVVQPYEVACWLHQGTCEAATEAWPFGDQEGQCLPGMAHAMAQAENPQGALQEFFDHGHTGFAWAARREVLTRHGLYDRQVLGGADLVMGHAMYQDAEFLAGNHSESRCFSAKQLKHIGAWSRRFFDDVQGSVGFVSGRVLHLWHGKKEDRQYGKRRHILKAHDFDPSSDLAMDASGCWKWASDKPELQAWIRDYFFSRREDAPDEAS